MMHASRAARYSRLALTAAALGILAALFLLQSPHARAQSDSTDPLLLATNVDGTSLVLIYNELLNESSTPAASDFTVDIGGTDYTPASAAVLGAEVALTLSTGATMGDTVTVDYTAGTNPVEDLAGNEAQDLTGSVVVNHTGATNDRPEFSSDTITITVDENTASLTAIGDPVAATDDDTGDTLTYEMDSPGTPPTFIIDTGTGQISVFGALDFETTSSYVAPMYVRDKKSPAGDTDDLRDDSIKVTITVNDVNEPPAISGLTTAQILENTTTIGTYTVTDPDPSDTHTWSIDSDTSTAANRDGALFEIGSTSGELSFINAPDFEARGSSANSNSYVVTVKVTDNGSPAESHTFDVTVNVQDVNEAPVITTTGSSHTAISKPEGTSTTEVLATYAADDPEDDTLTWTLSGADATDFTITRNSNGEGVLRFQHLTDFESPSDTGGDNDFNVTVEVKDTSGSAVDDDIDVTVTITNIDEPGTVALPGTITAGTPVTATLSDHDGTSSSESWTWSRSDTPGGTFTPISGATSNPYTPVVADIGKYLKATVTYTDPHGSGKSATSAASSQVRAGNVNPSFSATTATRSVPENSASGVNVGAAVAATPGDSDTLVYTLSGTDASSFTIVQSSGQIQTKSGVTYNFESPKKTYSVTVSVRDNKDDAGDADTADDDTIDVTINLTDVNEPPVIGPVSVNISIPENTPTTDVLATYTATDPEENTLTWTLSGDDAGDFDINSSTGALTFKNAPDYEDPADQGTDNIYNLTVQVSDGKNPQDGTDSAIDDTIAVTVTVRDVNEAPVITTKSSSHTALSKPEGTLTTEILAVYEADNPEGGSEMLTWTLTGPDADKFTIAGNSADEANLRFSAEPNYEDPQDVGPDNVYNVTVQVRDSKINTSDNNGDPDTMTDDFVEVIVTVTNVDEAGTVTITGTLAGGETLTASVSDIDGTVSNLSWRWARGTRIRGPSPTSPGRRQPPTPRWRRT